MIPTRSNEEIETYSVLSKAVYIGEVESPDVNELAKLSPRVELKGNYIERRQNFLDFPSTRTFAGTNF